MGILAGPFVGAAALLALAGLFKAGRPGRTAKALRSAGLGPLAPLARLLGVAEVATGTAALAVDSRALAALVGAFYLGFAGFVALSLLRKTPVADCGCFGATDSPPSVLHLVLNVAAAAVAFTVAAGSSGNSLPSALGDDPVANVAFLVLAAVVTGLAYAALTVLSATTAELKS